METFSRTIKTTYNKPVNIYFIGDTHEGNCNCDVKSIKKAVKIIQDDNDGYWFGMGDYIDAVVHGDGKRFDPSSVDPKYRVKDLKNLPMLQIYNFYGVVKPIREKCLGLIIGNHEASYAKYNSADVYKYLIGLMGDTEERRKELTLGMVAMGCIGIDEGGERDRPRGHFTICINHGDGGNGILPGYPTSKVFQVFNYSMADINVMGHIHQLEYFLPKVIDFNNRTKKLMKKRRLFGCSGTFLETYVDGNANYFEHKGRREGDIGMLKVSISLDGEFRDKKITAEKIILA